MTAVCVFIKYNVRSVVGLRDQEKTIVMGYVVEPGMPHSVAEAIPPEVGESNHIHVQPSRIGGQSDEAVQPIAVNNFILHPIPSPIVDLDLHIKDGLEEQDEFLNNKLGINHDDCNVGEFNVEEAAHDSNERSIAGSIGAQSVSIELELELFMYLAVMIFLAQ
ncbi:hypothetical protein TIFTF001_024094 [Ficus carica]|uniref:Uncharacterized protein n=1 Tax=Ficus carica TaxID=3494 RepID=A0AA88AMS2_FICCA|nr:hypothetical protein TIFTF001_024094 [Ficus carica]